MATPKNYTRSFATTHSAQEVYDTISNVKGWWTPNTDGTATRTGDEFTIHFGKLWKTMRVTKAQPGKRIEWQVIDCHMPFLTDKKEWKGTTLRFDLEAVPTGTTVTLTHLGLVPGLQCYEACENAWGYYFGEELPKALREAAKQKRPMKTATA